MKAMKTNKSLLKRIRITGRNKFLKRRPHQNHFNAKESGDATRGKRGNIAIPLGYVRDMKALVATRNLHD